VRETLRNCGAEVLELASEFGEHALSGGLSGAFFAAMQLSADVTGLVAFRFLSAWTALNSGDLESCVTECDKIDEPHAPVLTLQGQALLELGRTNDAIDALQSAVTMVPDELLAWFQLAKAHHVAGRWSDAWTALERSRRLAPDSDEVALLTALSALGAPAAAPRQKMLEEAWRCLSPHLPALADNIIVVVTLLQVCMQADDKNGALQTVQGAAWDRLAPQRETYMQLSPILLGLKDKQWFDVVGQLLAKLTPEDRQ
jgi:tetratricopeptide (TPR) repeat protein